jgi:hypothetical protein
MKDKNIWVVEGDYYSRLGERYYYIYFGVDEEQLDDLNKFNGRIIGPFDENDLHNYIKTVGFIDSVWKIHNQYRKAENVKF